MASSPSSPQPRSSGVSPCAGGGATGAASNVPPAELQQQADSINMVVTTLGREGTWPASPTQINGVVAPLNSGDPHAGTAHGVHNVAAHVPVYGAGAGVSLVPQQQGGSAAQAPGPNNGPAASPQRHVELAQQPRRQHVELNRNDPSQQAATKTYLRLGTKSGDATIDEPKLRTEQQKIDKAFGDIKKLITALYPNETVSNLSVDVVRGTISFTTQTQGANAVQHHITTEALMQTFGREDGRARVKELLQQYHRQLPGASANLTVTVASIDAARKMVTYTTEVPGMAQGQPITASLDNLYNEPYFKDGGAQRANSLEFAVRSIQLQEALSSMKEAIYKIWGDTNQSQEEVFSAVTKAIAGPPAPALRITREEKALFGEDCLKADGTGWDPAKIQQTLQSFYAAYKNQVNADPAFQTDTEKHAELERALTRVGSGMRSLRGLRNQIDAEKARLEGLLNLPQGGQAPQGQQKEDLEKQLKATTDALGQLNSVDFGKLIPALLCAGVNPGASEAERLAAVDSSMQRATRLVQGLVDEARSTANTKYKDSYLAGLRGIERAEGKGKSAFATDVGAALAGIIESEPQRTAFQLKYLRSQTTGNDLVGPSLEEGFVALALDNTRAHAAPAEPLRELPVAFQRMCKGMNGAHLNAQRPAISGTPQGTPDETAGAAVLRAATAMPLPGLAQGAQWDASDAQEEAVISGLVSVF